MTRTPSQAFAAAPRLPDAEPEGLAATIPEELADDERGEAALARCLV